MRRTKREGITSANEEKRTHSVRTCLPGHARIGPDLDTLSICSRFKARTCVFLCNPKMFLHHFVWRNAKTHQQNTHMTTISQKILQWTKHLPIIPVWELSIVPPAVGTWHTFGNHFHWSCVRFWSRPHWHGMLRRSWLPTRTAAQDSHSHVASSSSSSNNHLRFMTMHNT